MIDPETNEDFDERPTFDEEINTVAIEESIRAMLTAFGENPDREGLQNTPKRVARMYPELLSGYRTDVDKLVNGAIFNVTYDDMVIVRDIE
ncbi:MAG TPA: GTP cyclohydrolase I, partial [Anaerolineales bacterium]|nr:GTP cyclohydrolase I [Anaerolineales bacterium]